MVQRESKHMRKAREILAEAQTKKLLLAERIQMAIHLAASMLEEARRQQTSKERRLQGQLARMMSDPHGKAFTTAMTDESFRSHSLKRCANQMVYLLNKFGIPRYLSWTKRLQLAAFQLLGQSLAFLFVPLAIWMLRRETASVILPGESGPLAKHMAKRRLEGVRLNLNHLGEAILGEKEADHRLHMYLDDLKRPNVEYISIKISTIFSQINLLAWEKSIEIIAKRLRFLYRSAMQNTFTHADGRQAPKFVNLDMEEYRDLHLTKEVFKQVLSEPEFHHFSAGIVLQAYLPDSYEIQRELTSWALERIKTGGAPIKIRIVKGANLAMEQVEASLRAWPQAPYSTKADVDANYKRMVLYGCKPEHTLAVHVAIASHNLFDIAYALLVRAENGVEQEVSFEMLEGMADHIRRVVQKLAGDILLYCPVATRQDFQSAVAYLIRRLDENTGPENFLRHTFGLRPHTDIWESQASLFQRSCERAETVSHLPRRSQDRHNVGNVIPIHAPFANEPDTDFSLIQNRLWGQKIVTEWKAKSLETIPLVIGGQVIHGQMTAKSCDPSHPQKTLYTYTLASWQQVDQALLCAKEYETTWNKVRVVDRCQLLAKAAQVMRERRGDLIGSMIADGGKTLLEADPEVSEAIDFAEYYLRSMLKMDACTDILWSPKGTVLVAPPWNFPISIPAGGILAALIGGNCVLFKPAPEAVLSGWMLVNALWDAGIPKEALQFLNCVDDPVGSQLIKDTRLNVVILTGGTSTARLFQKMRPSLDLAAETGGKNAIIVTALADRDLAIKDLVSSAFGHSGQKCSAASLAILEAEVYDDPHFLEQLKDAVESLPVGSQWDPSSKVIPLIRAPGEALLRGLTKLESGETWLVQPKQDPQNPHLWSPGVKLGVKEGSYSHQTEFFGPVLNVMRAKNLDHAICLANDTPYGLTSGLQSLDEREQHHWMEKIDAGNCYINRSITGAIVRRQPFGGFKGSSFGHGAKAGGPNYVAQFCIPQQVSLPQEKKGVCESINQLASLLCKFELSDQELGIWYASIGSYAYFADHLCKLHDPSLLIGQDNFFRYQVRNKVCFRIQGKETPLDIFRIFAAALSCKVCLEVSWSRETSPVRIESQWSSFLSPLCFTEESEASFHKRLREGAFARVRCIAGTQDETYASASASATYIDQAPVLANGRFELLHFLREQAISIDYHRYGNLGLREGEKRHPIG